MKLDTEITMCILLGDALSNFFKEALETILMKLDTKRDSFPQRYMLIYLQKEVTISRCAYYKRNDIPKFFKELWSLDLCVFYFK
jgi:hypothetical protein